MKAKIDFRNLREFGTLYPTRAQVVKRVVEVTEHVGAAMKKMGKSCG